MGRRYDAADPVALALKAEMIRSGVTDERAQKALGLSKSAWNSRMHDTGLFRSREIRQLRKLLPDAICDAITK